MYFKTILSLIPKQRRKPFVTNCLLDLFRNLLDLVGLASILPVIIVIFDSSTLKGNNILARVFRHFNLESVGEFGLVLALGVLLFLPLKSMLTIFINKRQQIFLLGLYKYYSSSIYDLYHNRGLRYIKKTHSTMLSQQINGVCYAFAISVVGNLIGLFSDACIATILVLVAIVISPSSSLLLLVALFPILAVYFWIVRKKLKDLGRNAYDMRQKQAALVQESLRGYVSMTVNGSDKLVKGEFMLGLDDISENDVTISTYSQIPSLLMQLCVAIALIVLILITEQKDNASSIFIVFGFLAVRLLPSILRISGRWNNLNSADYVISTIKEIQGEEDEIVVQEQEPMTFEKEIRVSNLSYAFEDGEVVLDNFNMTVAKGEMVGISGPSGSGKSTLFNLLLGFYKSNSGAIYIDDNMLTEASRRSWLNIVGYSEQDVFISSDTLGYNIALSRDIDRTRIEDVLSKVGLKDWYDALPDALDTVMDEQGNNVSGGERQRLGLARALYKKAKVLFLDETTSALDAGNEDNIMTLLREIVKKDDLTVFIISHRENTLKMCDRQIKM